MEIKTVKTLNAVGVLLKKRCFSNLVRKWKLGGSFACPIIDNALDLKTLIEQKMDTYN